VEDRLVVTVVDADGEPFSRWEPLSLDGLSELQVAVYDYVRSRYGRTPPVDADELVSELDTSPKALSEARLRR
jgi:hypothetical protein